MGEDKQTSTTFELLNQGSRPFLRWSGTLTLSVIYKTILLEWKRKIYNILSIIFAGNFYSINAIKVLNFTYVL